MTKPEVTRAPDGTILSIRCDKCGELRIVDNLGNAEGCYKCGEHKGMFDRFQDRFSGHVSLGNLTIYGFNAMHVAINFWVKRWGYICFHPPMRCFGRWWPWYFYVSPNATPWAASFAIGPGVDYWERQRATGRRWIDVYRRMNRLFSDEFYELRDYSENARDEGFVMGMELVQDIVMGRTKLECRECGKPREPNSATGLWCPDCKAGELESIH